MDGDRQIDRQIDIKYRKHFTNGLSPKPAFDWHLWPKCSAGQLQQVPEAEEEVEILYEEEQEEEESTDDEEAG